MFLSPNCNEVLTMMRQLMFLLQLLSVSYKVPPTDILGSHLSITYCFLPHHLLGQEQVSAILKAKTFS